MAFGLPVEASAMPFGASAPSDALEASLEAEGWVKVEEGGEERDAGAAVLAPVVPDVTPSGRLGPGPAFAALTGGSAPLVSSLPASAPKRGLDAQGGASGRGGVTAPAAATAAPLPRLLWGADSVDADTLKPASPVPPIPFSLKATHRVLIARDELSAQKLLVQAIVDAGADVAVEGRPANEVQATFMTAPGRSEAIFSWFCMAPAPGDAQAYVAEARKAGGDAMIFHSCWSGFCAKLSALARAAGVGVAESFVDSRLPPLSRPADGVEVKPIDLDALLSAADEAKDAATAETLSVGSDPASEATTTSSAASASAEEVESFSCMSYDVIVSMLRSEYDDVREEGASRVYELLTSDDDKASMCSFLLSAGKPASRCGPALRERGVLRDLVRALVRAQSGCGCRSSAALSLARLADCKLCCADLVGNGAVFALASSVMLPCSRQTVQLRRAAVSGLGKLLVIPDASAQAIRSGCVAYLRLAATKCEDQTFRALAGGVADRADPDHSVSAAPLDMELAAAASAAALEEAKKLASGGPLFADVPIPPS